MALLAGRPLISYPLAAMRDAVGEVVVVAKASRPLPAGLGVRVVREASAVQHPLVGLREALGLSGARPALICAVDLPFVDADVLRALVEARGAPAVVASCGGEMQPLLGCYRPSALELLPEGGSLREAVASIGARTLEVPERALFNVNTPEDLARAETMLKTGLVVKNLKRA